MRIFISYRSKDRSAVTQLVNDLKKSGYRDRDIFWDQLFLVLGGKEWWEDILQNIRACDVFIAILSSAYIDSEACIKEYNYAFKLDRYILPLNIEDKFKPTTSGLNALDLRQILAYKSEDKNKLDAIINSLKRAPTAVPIPNGVLEPDAPRSELSEIAEQITNLDLNLEEQFQLVNKLRYLIDMVPEYKEDGIKLLQRFQQNRKLFYQVGIEINNIISGKVLINTMPTQQYSDERYIELPMSELIRVFDIKIGNHIMIAKPHTVEEHIDLALQYAACLDDLKPAHRKSLALSLFNDGTLSSVRIGIDLAENPQLLRQAITHIEKSSRQVAEKLWEICKTLYSVNNSFPLP